MVIWISLLKFIKNRKSKEAMFQNSIYSIKTAQISQSFETSWDEAQNWCNFILFKPNWLPEGLTEITTNSMRPESPQEPSAHRVAFRDLRKGRSLSIKQFLYDWAPPAYDHPCLWRNPKISTSDNTPLPKSYLIGNNYLWIGLDYRRKPAATINLLRTQIEMTILKGSFDDQELIQIIKSMTPVNLKTKEAILGTSFAELTFHFRHESREVPVPTSYFDYQRPKDIKCYPYPARNNNLNLNDLPGSGIINKLINNYRLDSLLLFGKDKESIQETEYYFEHVMEPGIYVRFLVTKQNTPYSIPFPPSLCKQECHFIVHALGNGEKIYHAWAKNNDNGSHSLIFQDYDCTINCIVKPAPWTSIDWAKELCAGYFQSE